MSAYSLARGLYRCTDRLLLSHLPAQQRVQSWLWRLARRLFPGHIEAPSASAFAQSVHARADAAPRLPAWAEAEVAALARYEPLLAPLTGAHRSLERYIIPWDLNYVGQRYAKVRRQLRGRYGCLILSGAGACAVDMVMLAAAKRPLAIIDVAGDVRLAALADAADAEYVAFPAEDLDRNDHAALLARLVLQLAPTEVLPTPHPTVIHCLQRHGRAMASVSRLLPLPAAGATASPEAAR